MVVRSSTSWPSACATPRDRPGERCDGRRKPPDAPSRKVRETPQKIGTVGLTLLYRQVRPFRTRSCSRCAVFSCCHSHGSPARAHAGPVASSSLWPPAESSYPAPAASRLFAYPDCGLFILLPLQRLPQCGRLAQQYSEAYGVQAPASLPVGSCAGRRRRPEIDRSAALPSAGLRLDAHPLELRVLSAHAVAPSGLSSFGRNRTALAASGRLCLEASLAGGPR